METINVLPRGVAQASAAAQQPSGTVQEAPQMTGGDISGEPLFSPLLLQMIIAQQTPTQVVHGRIELALPRLPVETSPESNPDCTVQQARPHSILASAGSVKELLALNNQKTNVSIESMKDGIRLFSPAPELQLTGSDGANAFVLTKEAEKETDVPLQGKVLSQRWIPKTNAAPSEQTEGQIQEAGELAQQIPPVAARRFSEAKIELDVMRLSAKEVAADHKEAATVQKQPMRHPAGVSAEPVLPVPAKHPESVPAGSKPKSDGQQNDEKQVRGEVKYSVPPKDGKNLSLKNDNENSTPQQSEHRSNGLPAAQTEPPLKTADTKEQKQLMTHAALASTGSAIDIKETQAAHGAAAVQMKTETAQSVIEQLSKNISLAFNDAKSEMKVVLHPESLGEVVVRVQVEEGKVTTQLDVQQQQVKNIIELNLPQLKEALANKGLTVERIDVFASELSFNGQASQQQKKNNSGSSRTLQEQDEAIESSKLFGYNTIDYVI